MKLQSTKKFGGAFVACVMAVGLTLNAGASRAADGHTIGVLDEARLGEGYTKYRSAMEDLNSRAKASDAEILARRFLAPTETKRFDELAAKKATRSAADETEFQAMVTSAGEHAKEYSGLMGKPAMTRTKQEAADFKKWQEYQKDNVEAADKMDMEAFQILKSLQQSTDKQYIDNANAMVQKVAVDKKLTVLLRKDAIIWNTPTVDITDEVLNRLNKQ